MRFQILALSGGGFLGLYAAKILAELERRASRPLGQCFDLICGTSIGGILALGLGAEIPAADMLATFEREGPRIFSTRPKPRGLLAGALDLGRMAWASKYTGVDLRRVTEGLLGERRLSDSRHRLLIPAVNMTQGTVRMFKTGHTQGLTQDHPLRMVDIAMATSAAPTYFPLAEVNHAQFADGGLVANAPDYCGLHEASCFLDQRIEEVYVLSIGTTTATFGIAHAKGNRSGAWSWVKDGRLLATMIGAQQQLTDDMMRHRLERRYIRLDATQSKDHQAALALDVATPEAQRTILGLADGTIQKDLGDARIRAMLDHRPQAPHFFNDER